ncbi:UDP-N-acetylmuramoyl-L-alanine--D-glutamate ligase [bacterium]|nr:UDP-N-acetylmuramoyl-L-alanine--D-glutamate ligase [bacterium]
MDNRNTAVVSDNDVFQGEIVYKGRAHVVGMGKSGLASARLLVREGWDVIISDKADGEKLAEVIKEMDDMDVRVFTGGHDEALREEVDLAVLSPGIPMDAEVVSRLTEVKIPLISELELGWRFCKGRMAAITGSNGKTTTTALLGEIFAQTGNRSITCGNIGRPLSDAALQATDETLLAVEVSSFQLMTIDRFRPDVAVLLNLSADHLDWHGGFDRYAKAKSRLWMNQTENDWLVYCADDANVSSLVTNARSKLFPYTVRANYRQPQRVDSSCRAYIDDDDFRVILPDGSEFRQPRSDLKLLGRHNAANALAAISAALLLSVEADAVRRGISGFKGYPHRLEIVRVINGVTWINDSKATNVDAGIVALEATDKPVILIAGGRAKGGGFSALMAGTESCPTEGAVDKIKTAILMGEAENEIRRDIGDRVKTIHAEDMEDAVRLAHGLAKNGDTVLLSPLCASFDMFGSYEERGDLFRTLVEELPNG